MDDKRPQQERPPAPDPSLKLPSEPLTARAAAGPLLISGANARYFAIGSGDAADRRVVCLTGSHIWNNFRDAAPR